MISKLVIKGFKSIEDSGELELKPLTIFVGPNSSGKSNLIEGIAILAQAAKLRPDYTRSLETSLIHGEFFAYPSPPWDFVAHKRELERWISLEIQIKPDKNIASRILEIAGKHKILSKYIPKSISSIGYAYSYKPSSREVSQKKFS
jgi:predicted ATPase